MNLATVMTQLATQLDTIDGLRVHGHPPDKITPPAAVVTYPDDYTFDGTYGRGMDRLQLPVVVMVGRVSARASRDDIGRFCDGDGDDSIKSVLEAGTYTAMDSVRVTKAVFDIIAMAGVEYLAATFTVDIAGKGVIE